MISMDTSDLSASIERVKREINFKLERMVISFAADSAAQLSLLTPKGDPEALQDSPKYRSYYIDREEEYDLPLQVGWHAGAWGYSSNGQFSFNSALPVQDEEGVSFDVKQDMQTSYRLGQPIYIGQRSPGIESLGKDQYPAEDIFRSPLGTFIRTSLQADLKRFYDFSI